MEFKPSDTVTLRSDTNATGAQLPLLAQLQVNTAYFVEGVVHDVSREGSRTFLKIGGRGDAQFPASWFTKPGATDYVQSLRETVGRFYPNAINTMTAQADSIVRFVNERIEAGVKKIEEFEKLRSRYEMLTEILARPDLGVIHKGGDGAFMLITPEWNYYGPYQNLNDLLDDQLKGAVEPNGNYKSDTQ